MLLLGYASKNFLSLARLHHRNVSSALSQAPKLTKMGKKKSSTPGEENLLLPTPPSSLPIVDTHTHVASTYEYYRGRYKEGKHLDAFSFVKAMYEGRNVASVVDVWCEAPVHKQWKEYADAAQDKEKWGGLEYFFVMGAQFCVSSM